MKIYSALYADFHPLDVFFPLAECKVAETPDDLDGKGVLILHGGSDINPDLYGKGRSRHTYDSAHRRDALEMALLKAAVDKNIFIFGICRGAQMLCAAAGGYLIQDVTNHSGWHEVTDNKGKTFVVNSIHHQMQAPWDIKHELLAVSEPLSSHFLDEDKMVKVPNEPEAVWYPELKGLGLQWHPEMMNADEEANQWAYEVLKEKMGGNV